jgi:hypothetical protein
LQESANCLIADRSLEAQDTEYAATHLPLIQVARATLWLG